MIKIDTICLMIKKLSFQSRTIATIFCLLSCLVMQNACAATWAIVKSEKAVIYSDIQMTSIIGYLKKGKKIRVGEVPKNKARLLPVIISKKVAYIQVKDINTGHEVDSLRSVTERVQEKMHGKKSINRVAIIAGTYYASLSEDNFDSSLGSDLLFINWGIRGYYTNIQTRKGLRVSLQVNKATKNDATISYTALPISFKFKGYNTKKYDFNLFFGGVIIPYSEFKLGNDFKITGQGLGAEVGGELRFSISKNYSIHLDGNFQAIKLLNMDLPENSVYPERFDPFLTGVKLMAVLSYEY